MSFFGMSSSSSPPAASASSSGTPPPSSSQLAEMKSKLLALPSGLAQVSSRRRKKAKKAAFLTTFLPNGKVPRILPLSVQSISAQLTASQFELFSTSSTVPVFRGYSFALSSFSGSGPYAALFDQYMLEEVEFWLTPENAAGTAVYGQVSAAVDFDDANTPTTNLMVVDKQQSIVTAGGTAIYVRFRPHMAIAVYSGAFTSFGNQPAGWIDIASPSVQHYGVKLAFTPTPATLTYVASVRGHFRFRNPGIA